MRNKIPKSKRDNVDLIQSQICNPFVSRQRIKYLLNRWNGDIVSVILQIDGLLPNYLIRY
jgi:hypothetical protein